MENFELDNRDVSYKAMERQAAGALLAEAFDSSPQITNQTEVKKDGSPQSNEQMNERVNEVANAIGASGQFSPRAQQLLRETSYAEIEKTVNAINERLEKDNSEYRLHFRDESRCDDTFTRCTTSLNPVFHTTKVGTDRPTDTMPKRFP